MGSVPEDDSHCKVRSLPSVSSPSNSHLGFDGLTSKKNNKEVKDPLALVNNILLTCFSSKWSTFECGFNSSLLPSVLYISLPKIYPLPSPAHIHSQFQLFPVLLI